jgi:NADH-quinone oxidoreductase subunit A
MYGDLVDFMNIDILLSPPIAFVIFLAVCYALFFLCGLIAPKSVDKGGKLESYACGEDMPGQKIQFGYDTFFLFAIFFTIMHVAALVVATVPAGMIVFFGIFYLCTIFIAVLSLLTRN